MTPAPVQDGLAVPQRHWAILTLALGVCMAVLDGAIANIALPSIAQALQVSAAASVWVVNAYQLAVIATLLAFASLGDIHGYRRVYRFGLALFTLASGLCALSGTLAWLVAARVLQGVGAGALMSVSVALVRVIYPKQMLGRGLGINALIVALSSAAGPTLAAAVLAAATWPWLFAVNLPIGLLAWLLSAHTLPSRPPHKRDAFDPPSAVLNALFFLALIFSLDSLTRGAPALTTSCLLATLVLGFVFVRRQLGLTAPLLPVDLLKIRLFSLSIGTSVCSFVAQMLAMVSLPFFLQQVLGRSEVMTGLLLTPWPIAIMLVAPRAGKLAERHAPGALGAAGLLLFAAGLFALARLTPAASDTDIIWRMLLCGVGFGLFQSPNNYAMLTAVPARRSGGASGMLGTARLLGQTLGATLAGLMFHGFGVEGTHHALMLAMGFALAAAAVSGLRLTPARPDA